MGRPINKRKIGQGDGKILCSAYYFTSASEVNGATTPAWIVSQRSTNKFNVTDGTTTEVLTLVNETAGSLAEGTFIINAMLDDSSTVQVTKLRNRTVQYEGGTTNVANVKFNIGNGLQAGSTSDDTAEVEGQ
jgi:hypothetical protein